MELIDLSALWTASLATGEKFHLKHWTVGMQERVEAECYVIDAKTGRVTFMPSRERTLKLELSLAGWEGVTAGEKPVEFSTALIPSLPVGVQVWLAGEIDRVAGFRMPDTEKKT